MANAKNTLFIVTMLAAAGLCCGDLQAQTSNPDENSHCYWDHRPGWEDALVCEGHLKTKDLIVDTLCASSSIDGRCVNSTYERVPGRPASIENNGHGVAIMRGGTADKWEKR